MNDLITLLQFTDAYQHVAGAILATSKKKFVTQFNHTMARVNKL